MLYGHARLNLCRFHTTSALLLIALLAAGCAVLPEPLALTATAVLGPSATPSVPVVPWEDASAVMAGICFEAANDAAGQVFILRGAEEHIRLYELADNSGLCRRPVERRPFDFDNGRVLAGLWSAGRGCTARHDVLSATRDDGAQTIDIRLAFITEGDCPYELVRPFWIALENAAQHTITIEVVESAPVDQ